MSQPEERPEERQHHESAVVDGHLYLFGGKQSSSAELLDRDVIWVGDLRAKPSKRRWVRHSTLRLSGRIPSCERAACVVIDKMIYSYGGKKKDRSFLGIVYRLDPKKMEWIEVSAAYVEGKKPAPRAHCCLCVVGSRMIMFGGEVKSGAELQSGATENKEKWTNEIYEFELQEGRETGK